MYRVISSSIVCHDDSNKVYENFADGSNWVPEPMLGVREVTISPDAVITFVTR